MTLSRGALPRGVAQTVEGGHGARGDAPSLHGRRRTPRVRRRPDGPEQGPEEAGGGSTAAAIAANVAYVCAHIAGQLAAASPAGYEGAFRAERERQARWLADKLSLSPPPSS
jgi:hypothetical protein